MSRGVQAAIGDRSDASHGACHVLSAHVLSAHRIFRRGRCCDDRLQPAGTAQCHERRHARRRGACDQRSPGRADRRDVHNRGQRGLAGGAGQLRALAVTSAERSAAFPQLPTVAEAGVPGYAAESWYGLYAPAKTPAPVIARLNQAVAKAVQSGAFKQLEANEGLIMVGSAPEQLDRYVGQEEDRWRKLVKDANIEVQ
ncbi:tripartite tricarboxylate transporter substrate-binding protein [Bradyrhizobium vignae]|uniref:tripartite tricarboxylate transporter substrate-binding protein n=1 Tax=Bradyrhizobium vignae TaxID=1549949 RepID=UPI001FCE7BB8|nr:tripartite tricarboxylate transporter substrate-binding protein [Bradyrhizobium vignae]